jgi:hypothetical protein
MRYKDHSVVGISCASKSGMRASAAAEIAASKGPSDKTRRAKDHAELDKVVKSNSSSFRIEALAIECSKGWGATGLVAYAHNMLAIS